MTTSCRYYYYYDLVLSITALQFTLMNWGNAIVRKIVKNIDGVVTSMEGELHLEGDFTSTKWKLTWLPDIPELIPVRLSPTPKCYRSQIEINLKRVVD